MQTATVLRWCMTVIKRLSMRRSDRRRRVVLVDKYSPGIPIPLLFFTFFQEKSEKNSKFQGRKTENGNQFRQSNSAGLYGDG